MALKLAHIVNPVVVSQSSDLFVAQPITFQTMIEARRLAAPQVEVALLSAQFLEDRGYAPPAFVPTADLEQSILDFGKFKVRRKLPLIKDILDRLFEGSNAEYLIYTNVDIGVQPYFYTAIAELIGQGYDAFTINRRIISNRFTRPAELPVIWAEVGQPHRGHDCFVFHRSLYPKFRLGRVCIGTGYIGKSIVLNFLCHGKNVTLFSDKHLTFHIGEERRWRGRQVNDILDFNKRECAQVLAQLNREFGEFACGSIGEQKLRREDRRSPIKRLADTWNSRRQKKPAGNRQ